MPQADTVQFALTYARRRKKPLKTIFYLISSAVISQSNPYQKLKNLNIHPHKPTKPNKTYSAPNRGARNHCTHTHTKNSTYPKTSQHQDKTKRKQSNNNTNYKTKVYPPANPFYLMGIQEKKKKKR